MLSDPALGDARRLSLADLRPGDLVASGCDVVTVGSVLTLESCVRHPARVCKSVVVTWRDSRRSSVACSMERAARYTVLGRGSGEQSNGATGGAAGPAEERLACGAGFGAAS